MGEILRSPNSLPMNAKYPNKSGLSPLEGGAGSFQCSIPNAFPTSLPETSTCPLAHREDRDTKLLRERHVPDARRRAGPCQVSHPRRESSPH